VDELLSHVRADKQPLAIGSAIVGVMVGSKMHTAKLLTATGLPSRLPSWYFLSGWTSKQQDNNLCDGGIVDVLRYARRGSGRRV